MVALIGSAWKSVYRAAPGLSRGVAVGFAASGVTILTASLVSNVISQLVVLWYFAAIAAAAIAAARLRPQAQVA